MITWSLADMWNHLSKLEKRVKKLEDASPSKQFSGYIKEADEPLFPEEPKDTTMEEKFNNAVESMGPYGAREKYIILHIKYALFGKGEKQ